MAVVSLASRITSAVVAAAGTQAFLTLTSIGYASGKFASSSPLLPRDSGKLPEETFDAHHYDFMTEFVTGLYQGRGRKNHDILAHHKHVQVDDGVTFGDPAALCVGKGEVSEAFRALTFLQPRTLQPPRCVHVQPQGETIQLTFAMYQQYQIGSLATISLPSLLLVDVQLRQRHDVPESDFLVLAMEEHWNGVPVLSSYLFWIVRRLNGKVSYPLTKQFLKSGK